MDLDDLPLPDQCVEGLGALEASTEESVSHQEQTGPDVPEGHNQDHPSKGPALDNPKRRYARHGKRRRSYTEELFRCQFTDMISRTPLVCNHLLWKSKPQELRDHLLEHMKVAEVLDLSDSQVLAKYTDAKKIYLEGIPEDCDDNDEDQTEEESNENE